MEDEGREDIVADDGVGATRHGRHLVSTNRTQRQADATMARLRAERASARRARLREERISGRRPWNDQPEA